MKHSVIIPAYNAAAYIEQCLGSVLSQLGPNDEIVVVDDGSTDTTVQVVGKVRDARVQLLSQLFNSGISAARNRALVVVSGDYVHFLDHDDLWASDRMTALSSVIEVQQPDIVSGWVEHFYCPTLKPTQTSQYYLPSKQAASLPGSVVLRLELIKQIGLFDPSLSSGEFIDFLSRAMALQPRWAKTDRVLYLRRIHGANHTLTDTTFENSYIKVIRRHLARTHALKRREDQNHFSRIHES
jgi:glycosyltransferase involved in cell wall biosynthesis